MVAFDINAALDGLQALLLTVPAMEDVQIGAPEDPPRRITAWITLGDPGEIAPYVQGVYELPIMLIVWFGYSVEGSEQAAEAQLADLVSAFTRMLIQNRMQTVNSVTRNLNGSVDRMWLPQAAAGVADYTEMSGREIRVYPLGIRVAQRENLGS